MKRLEDGSVSVFYTAQWNDMIDPDFQYESDKIKYVIGKVVSTTLSRNYILRIQWHNEIVNP